ncbi:MAG: PDZ domain-containing protein, partial [Planctomycetota bacterium]
MLSRVLCGHRWLAALLLIAAPAIARAQSAVPPRPATFVPGSASPARGAEQVRISGEAMPPAYGPRVDELLAEGMRLETEHRWADALGHYEKALRKHPSSARLEQRFDVARLHFSIERRYSDTSFLETLRTLDSRQATQLYSEMLRKIDAHYVVTPPWSDIASRGGRSLQMAVVENKFSTHHGLRLSDRQLRQFNAEVEAAAARRMFRSRADVVAYQADVARIVSYRLGVSPVATAMEFASAAVGGLDHYSAFLTPGQLRDVYSQIEGNFVGLGVELKADNGALLIVRVIPNSPAERAGIRGGDRITAV